MVLCGLLAGVIALVESNLAVNPGFEAGLAAWEISGDAHLTKQAPVAGATSLQLKAGAITQTLPMSGLRIVYIAAKVRGTTLSGELNVECLDQRGKVVMTNSVSFDRKQIDQQPGVYFKTQANTRKIRLTLRNHGPVALIDDVLVRDDTVSESHRPAVNLDEVMLPYWSSPIIYNETVLVESIKGATAAGTLLIPPKKVISVKDYGLKTTYIEGKDYRVTATGIEAVPGGNLPTVQDKDFPATDLPWTDLQGKHVLVTYEKTSDGPSLLHPKPSRNLPATRALLAREKPVRIVAFGDSITLGIGTSRYSQRPPYQPTWAELVATRLSKIYSNNQIKLYNTSLGGMTSDWAKGVAPEAVSSLKPDLVIFAFGMNDFWWIPAEQLKANVQAVMASVRHESPLAEFLLIAPMRFDPEYAREEQYPARLQSYAPVLRSLEGPGVAVLDMTRITGELYARKKPKDFLSDPLHPNDFLARIHAQWIVEMLSP
jgi:lysophospholipase L1-like esterase